MVQYHKNDVDRTKKIELCCEDMGPGGTTQVEFIFKHFG